MIKRIKSHLHTDGKGKGKSQKLSISESFGIRKISLIQQK